MQQQRSPSTPTVAPQASASARPTGGAGNAALAARAVGAADAPAEAAADSLAARVLAARRQAAPAGTAAPAPAGAAPADLLAAFLAVTGEDLAGVSIGTAGAGEAAALGATAFAADGAVHLAPGAPAPGTAAGDALLAHELAHVALGHATTGAPIRRTADLALGSLRSGARGDAVRRLQDALVTLGHLSAADRATGPGVFGPKTLAAVLAFQRRAGIVVDGVVGPQTEAALERALGGGGGPAAAPTRPAPTSGGGTVPPAWLEQGARGANVVALQQALTRLGHSPGGADGSFGPRTRAALEAFQRSRGLKPDGRYGPVTRDALAAALSGAPAAAPTTAARPADPAKVAAILSWARSMIGSPYAAVNPYRFGEVPWPGGTLQDIRGNNVGPFPSGTRVFDCSGFVVTAFKQAGINLGSIASSSLMRSDTTRLSDIAKSDLAPGDLITYTPNDAGVGHVVIFMGGNSAIDAAGRRGVGETTVDWGRADAFKRAKGLA
jgi:peptidoglycan hydrolase-like protein with peptidoglycan-binding domain